MSRPGFDSGVQFVWDATSLTALQTCKRKYHYQILHGWSSRKPSVHLVFGAHFARGVEEFWKLYYDTGEKYESLCSVVHAAMKRARKAPEYDTSTTKTRKGLIRTLVWYIDQFFDIDADSIHHTNGKPVLERSFTVDAGPFMLSGRMDRVIDRGDELFVMDQKTTGSSISTWYFDTFTPNNQVSAYLLAGSMIFEKPVRGMIIDAASIKANSSEFFRGFVPRTRTSLEEWTYGMASETEAVKDRDPDDPADWPQNPSACGYYAGCEFRKVCSLSPEARPAHLNSDFDRTQPWNPVKGSRDGQAD